MHFEPDEGYGWPVYSYFAIGIAVLFMSPDIFDRDKQTLTLDLVPYGWLTVFALTLTWGFLAASKILEFRQWDRMERLRFYKGLAINEFAVVCSLFGSYSLAGWLGWTVGRGSQIMGAMFIAYTIYLFITRPKKPYWE